MSDKVYGIDLGTTYSAVAMISDIGMAEIVKNFRRRRHDSLGCVLQR